MAGCGAAVILGLSSSPWCVKMILAHSGWSHTLPSLTSESKGPRAGVGLLVGEAGPGALSSLLLHGAGSQGLKLKGLEFLGLSMHYCAGPRARPSAVRG